MPWAQGWGDLIRLWNQFFCCLTLGSAAQLSPLTSFPLLVDSRLQLWCCLTHSTTFYFIVVLPKLSYYHLWWVAPTHTHALMVPPDPPNHPSPLGRRPIIHLPLKPSPLQHPGPVPPLVHPCTTLLTLPRVLRRNPTYLLLWLGPMSHNRDVATFVRQASETPSTGQYDIFLRKVITHPHCIPFYFDLSCSGPSFIGMRETLKQKKWQCFY